MVKNYATPQFRVLTLLELIHTALVIGTASEIMESQKHETCCKSYRTLTTKGNKLQLNNGGTRVTSVFSTRVPGNLRIPPMASNGSPELNRETGTKRHLWPLDAFSGLSVSPKCICGRPRMPLVSMGSVIAPPQEPLPRSRPSVSNFGPSGLTCAQDKFLVICPRVP